ncbi:MAG: VWA domain-containing protein [Planctomycetes bacterium]|nr:VWA domain-containing protein [Planctomycetota bacterium]
MADGWLGLGSPSALWALFSLLALLLFSFWRPRPRRVVVASLRLWSRIPRRAPPIRAARRPRLSMLLVVQALAVAALVGAMAEPSVEGKLAPPRRISVVVDTSARMGAVRADRRTRFEAARDRAVEAARELSHLDRATLFWIDDAPRRWEGPGTELAGRLRGIRPLRSRVPIEPLLRMAMESGDDVWVLSDRPWNATGRCREFLAGEPPDNSGVEFVSAEGNALFVRIVRHGPARDVRIAVSADGREVASETLRLEPGLRAWGRTIEAGEAKKLTVDLGGGDHLALDDRAVLHRFDPEDGVRLEGGEHPLLARALQAVPGVRLGRGRTAVLYRTLRGAGDTTVYVDPPGAPAGFELGERFVPKEWSLAGHPLTRDLRVEHFSSAGAREVRGGTPLAWADGRCVAAVRDRSIVLAFDLTPSCWPSEWSFVLFWTNVVDFARTGGAWRALRAGEPARLPADTTDVEGPPRNALFSFDRDGRELLAYDAGTYRARTPSGGVELAVNLLDARESDTAGVDRTGAADGGRAPSPARLPIGFHACVAASLLVFLSWLLELRSR